MGGERAIRIEADGVRLYAILADTPVADALWEALPLEGRTRLVPGAVTFTAAIACDPRLPPRTEAKSGELGFRPEGPTVLLFHAPPVPGVPPEPVPTDPVHIFGRITGDASRLARVKDQVKVKLTALEG
ncbi:MAG TPA: cyclophilin-like family protein [Candidatus Polarisedimenticolia bacterium]|nr:cyclophilin-like family protein [Candidatus Polarisedimenticolia bacterium]